MLPYISTPCWIGLVDTHTCMQAVPVGVRLQDRAQLQSHLATLLSAHAMLRGAHVHVHIHAMLGGAHVHMHIHAMLEVHPRACTCTYAYV